MPPVRREAFAQAADAVRERVGGILLAGHLRPVGSPIESVELPDDFLEWMEREEIPILAIPGNRGSPERLHLSSRIFSRRGIHIAQTGRVYPGLPYCRPKGLRFPGARHPGQGRR